MSKDEFKISGYEVKESIAKPHGNGARALVPKKWIGERVKVVKITDKSKEDTIAPLAVLMLERVESMNEYDFRKLLRNSTRYKHFNDVNKEIINCFDYCIDGPNTIERLKHYRNESNNDTIREFYTNLIKSSDSEVVMKSTLKSYI